MRQAEERLPEEGASKQKLKRGWLQRKAGRKGTVDVAHATQMSKGHTGNGAGQPRLCHSTGLPQSTLTTFLGLSLPTCREETLAAAFSQGPEDSGHLGQPQGVQWGAGLMNFLVHMLMLSGSRQCLSCPAWVLTAPQSLSA